MIQIGLLKGETVWDVIKQLEEPLLTSEKIFNAMLVTQVSIEQLFPSTKFILSHQRLEAILYCTVYANAEQ